MTTSAGMDVGLCTNCGTQLSGIFCSGCGSPAESAPASVHSEGWGGLAHQFLASPSRNGIFSVAFSFLRHPVDTIIRLTEDPAYRSHWSFLTACVGAQLTLIYVILPRILAAFFSTPDVSNNSAVITNEVVQYVGMAILTPIQYYLCRALGTIRRTPMSYVKLCVLSVSYGALLSMLATLIFFATIIGAVKTGAVFNVAILLQGLSIAIVLAILTFVTASHRRFWGMSWPVAICVSMVIAGLSWVVVYPALAAAAEKANIAGTLGRIFG